MKDAGALGLIVLVAGAWAGIFGFYGFLGWRARLWSPRWAITPTTQAFAAEPAGSESAWDKDILRGRRIYRALRCGVCHGPQGRGGVKNPNADPEGMVPNLEDLADAFTRADLKGKLLKGGHPAKLDEAEPEPPLDMPSWRKILTAEETEDLAKYLFSIKGPPGKSGEGAADEGTTD